MPVRYMMLMFWIDCSVCAQTNHEGVFIDLIHYARRYGGIYMVSVCNT